MRPKRLALLLLAVVPAPVLHAQSTVLVDASGVESAGYEDYTRSVGRMEGGVLQVRLAARSAAWRPWGQDGPALRTHVLAADGDAPRVPAPLIRVRVNTPIRITLRNELGDRLVVRGLRDAGALAARGVPPGPAGMLGDSLDVAAGAEGSVMFTPTMPGTFVYFGKTIGPGESTLQPTPLPARPADRSLWGVIIVDAEDEEATTSSSERILMITHWGERELPGSYLPASRFFINGLSWPHTERLEYAMGDTIRWRVLNMTGRPHPMHLHGAYFTIEARGGPLGDRVIPPVQRRQVVTEMLDIAQTMRISWVPHAPGNWLFHCHFMRHMSWLQTSLPSAPAERHVHPGAGGQDLLGGLVIGVTITPPAGYAAPADSLRRRLDLHITRRAAVFGDAPGYGFVLQDSVAPPADSVRFPGSTIVLTRGEPTHIVVHNHADAALGVHWHGLELESRMDGVPGFSGMPDAPVPAILPGDSFSVRITPPRSGTFMYHVHSEPSHQLAQGLYGPLVILDPDQSYDPETDRVFLLGSLGTGEDPPPAINGSVQPDPIELRVGTTYRLRFMHISPDDDKLVSLLSGGQPVLWRAVAKDGADLRMGQVRDVAAQLSIGVGETYDFLWTPAAGDYTLRVLTTFDRGAAGFPRMAPDPQTTDIRITVR